MENQKVEFASSTTEDAEAKHQAEMMRELLDNELLYVGGGTGNVIF